MARGRVEIGIRMNGRNDFIRTVNKFEREYIREVKAVIARTAQMIKSQAQALAPVDDGNLRDSIEINYFNRGLSAEIIVGSHYGVYVEFGTGIYSITGSGRKTPWVFYSDKLNRYVYTRGMQAQPFWNPTIEVASKYFQREMNKLG